MKRVPVGRVVDAPAAMRTEGEVTIVPVHEERWVLMRELVLVEELHLHRRRSVEPPRIIYVGRTKLQLSAFGEHVIEINPRISTIVYQDDLNLPYLGVKRALGEVSDTVRTATSAVLARSQAPDMGVLTPIFHERQWVGFAANMAHKSDIGGVRVDSEAPLTITLQRAGSHDGGLTS